VALANEAVLARDGPHPPIQLVTLTGRAPSVPYASVGSGHPRTTPVDADASRAAASLHTERSEGASQARVAMLKVLEVTARPRPPGQAQVWGAMVKTWPPGAMKQCG
jgi:hypothetical protein